MWIGLIGWGSTLAHRRDMADLCLVVKLFKDKRTSGQCLVDQTISTPQVTRRNPIKLRQQRSKTNWRHHFFSNKVVTKWNKLNMDVTAMNINEFKCALMECL